MTVHASRTVDLTGQTDEGHWDLVLSLDNRHHKILCDSVEGTRIIVVSEEDALVLCRPGARNVGEETGCLQDADLKNNLNQ